MRSNEKTNLYFELLTPWVLQPPIENCPPFLDTFWNIKYQHSFEHSIEKYDSLDEFCHSISSNCS